MTLVTSGLNDPSRPQCVNSSSEHSTVTQCRSAQRLVALKHPLQLVPVLDGPQHFLTTNNMAGELLANSQSPRSCVLEWKTEVRCGINQ